MKISKESIEKFVLDVQDVAKRDLGIYGIVKDTDSLHMGDLRVFSNVALVHMNMEFDIAVPHSFIESTDPCKITNND